MYLEIGLVFGACTSRCTRVDTILDPHSWLSLSLLLRAVTNLWCTAGVAVPLLLPLLGVAVALQCASYHYVVWQHSLASPTFALMRYLQITHLGAETSGEPRLSALYPWFSAVAGYSLMAW